MKRIYHHFELWEERKAGMWRVISNEEFEEYKHKASALMKDVGAFKAAMMRAANEWKYSCEHNLTDLSQNRKAWLGHAGSIIATGSPEDATRAGWWTLSQEEQDKANEAAEQVILWWEENKCQRDFSELLF